MYSFSIIQRNPKVSPFGITLAGVESIRPLFSQRNKDLVYILLVHAAATPSVHPVCGMKCAVRSSCSLAPDSLVSLSSTACALAIVVSVPTCPVGCPAENMPSWLVVRGDSVLMGLFLFFCRISSFQNPPLNRLGTADAEIKNPPGRSAVMTGDVITVQGQKWWEGPPLMCKS